MRIRNLYIKGLTVLREPVDIDFTQLPEGLIAITGPNGSGKTSLLSSTFAALYRFLPDRDGPLHKWCHGKDAQINLAFDFNGHAYDARLLIDAVTEKSEAFLTEDGKSIANGKVTAFDKEVERIFGPPKLRLSSDYSAQKRAGSFSRIPVAERKSLFIDLLGLGHYPELEKKAKAAYDKEQLELAVLRGQMDALQERVAELTTIEETIAGRRSAHAASELLRAAAEKDVATQDAALQDLNAKLAKTEAIEKEFNDAAAACLAARGALAAIREKITKRKAHLAWERSTLVQRQAQTATKLKDLEQRRKNNEALLIRRTEVTAAIQREADLKNSRGTLTAELTDAIAAAQTKHTAILKVTHAQGTIQALEQSIATHTVMVRELDGIPCQAKAPYSTCPKIVSSVAAREELPQLLQERERQQDALVVLERAASKNGHRDVYVLQQELQKIDADLTSTQLATKMMAAIEQADARIQELDQSIKETLAIQVEIGETLKMLGSDGLLDELIEQETAADQALGVAAQLQAQKSLLISDRKVWLMSITAVMNALQQAQASVKEHRDHGVAIASEIHILETKKMELEVAQFQVTSMAAAVANRQAEISDWQLLTKALSKDGVPALEIDTAGPGISSVVNELLSSCFSTRFAVDLMTQKASADGKKNIETFNLRVIDSDRGRDGTIDDLSGGEEVILSGALGLSIGIYNKGTRRYETLCLDELGASLDPANAVKFASMLRRAMAIGHFHRCLLVTHNPEVAELADARISVVDGKVSVE